MNGAAAPGRNVYETETENHAERTFHSDLFAALLYRNDPVCHFRRSPEAPFLNPCGSLTDPLMYVRLFTHVLGHSGFPHLIGNLTLILLLGPALEENTASPAYCWWCWPLR